VFLDTNIIVDFFAKRENFFFPASVIIDLAYHHKIDVYASSLTFVNAWYVLSRTYKVADLREKLSKLTNFCHISIVDEKIILDALNMPDVDFEDRVQIASAESVDTDVIITRNEKHFKGTNIKVASPNDFLDNFFGNA
jgi:predicted nucleic acid-binding protein